MADLFPNSWAVQIGAELPDRYRTLRSSDDAPTLRVVRKWRALKMRGGRLTYLVTGTTNLGLLRKWWAEHRGSGVPFDYRYPWDDSWTHLLVGAYTSLPMDVPVYDGLHHVIVNLETGAIVDASPTISLMTGTNGRDRVTAWSGAPPAAGTLLGLNTTGQRMITALFGDLFLDVEVGRDTYRVDMTLDEV